MENTFKPVSKAGLAVQIADQLKASMLSGDLKVDDRLPSEAELATRFGVSRPTVREALKRLAAKNLIRTTRGVTGGAFVNRIDWPTAQSDLASQSTLLISFNDIDFLTASKARFALERAALPFAIRNRTQDDINLLNRELVRQANKDTSDEAFCASDVAFHCAISEASCNPVLSYHVSAAIAAMQPLMNMLTYQDRDRAEILSFHNDLAASLNERNTDALHQALDKLEAYTEMLWTRRAPTMTDS